MRLMATFTDGSFSPVVEACVVAGFPLKTDPDTQQPTDFYKFDNSVMFASKEESQVATLGMVFWAMTFEVLISEAWNVQNNSYDNGSK